MLIYLLGRIFQLKAIFSAILLGISFSVYAWTDITARVRNETDLDEKIQSACSQNCQGNRRKGDLEYLHVQRIDPQRFAVRSRAYAKNHHHIDPPRVFGKPVGGGAAAYQWTLHVDASGVLNIQNCILKIDSINISGDDLGLAQDWARKNRGKTEYVQNCNTLVRGL